MRIVKIAAGALVGLILLIFVVALLLARGNLEQLGPIIQGVRDVFILVLALEGILIILSLAVVISQIARLVNLVKSETRPILENTQETVQYTKGTVQFMSDHLVEPIIKLSAFFAGVSTLLSELAGIRRAIQPVEKSNGIREHSQPE
jgi:hypothetical protein